MTRDSSSPNGSKPVAESSEESEKSALFDPNLYKELIDPEVFGTRGEQWFFAQIAIILLIFYPPSVLESITEVSGVLLMLTGLAAVAGGVKSIGSSISPFPTPRPTHSLITSGAYAWVRHPMYTGVVCIGVGLSLWISDPTRLALCVPLYYVLDKKAALEEEKLSQMYPHYEVYAQQVGRLLPLPIMKKKAEDVLTTLYRLLNKPTDEKNK